MTFKNGSDLEFKQDYWDDPILKEAFKSFLIEIHGLDLDPWDQIGYWDANYMPFSYFRGDEVIASLCLYLIDSIVNGERTKLVQISGVGTKAEYRRMGLNQELTTRALDWAAQGGYAGLYLFADEEAVSYYERTGFTSAPEFIHTWRPTKALRSGDIQVLDSDKDENLDLIYEMARNREPISDVFGVLNPELVMFHALYTLKDCSYFISDLDCIVFFRRKDRRLTIYEILSRDLPPFNELYPYISDPDDEEVAFMFHTDKLGLSQVEERHFPGENFFTRGNFPVKNPVFPFTSRA